MNWDLDARGDRIVRMGKSLDKEDSHSQHKCYVIRAIAANKAQIRGTSNIGGATS